MGFISTVIYRGITTLLTVVLQNRYPLLCCD